MPGYRDSHLCRRDALKSLCGVVACPTIGMLCQSVALAADEDSMPKPGDFLAFAKGEKKGQTIEPQDLVAEAQPILAYPKDPATGNVKDQTKKSLILLYKTAPANLSPELAAQSAEGALGFSALCTHLGCAVEEWDNASQCAVCPCHKGTYDLKQAAKVVSGPPPKSLPLLPLKLADQNIVVAAGFSGRVGAQRQS